MRLAPHLPQNLRRGARISVTELMVVLTIIGLLATLIVPQILGALDRAKTKATRSEIEQISAALDYFKVDNGRYPTSEEGLPALTMRPGGLATWNGPYLSKASVNEDGWSRAFQYTAKGDAFTLYSFGADGRPGGAGEDADLGLAVKN
jgi:general secretion pathway protein G